MQMTKEMLDFIAGAVETDAAVSELDAGYSGRFDDGGASRLRQNLVLYRLGFERIVPPAWDKHAKSFENLKKEEQFKKDPEYLEFLRLQEKFK